MKTGKRVEVEKSIPNKYELRLLTVKPKIMRRMKFKLPIVVGSLFVLLSLPFIFGFLQPSMHEGGYSVFYVLLNMPAIIVVSGVAQKIETSLMKNYDLYTANIISMTFLLLFWLAISFICGVIFDEIKRTRNPRQA